MQLASPLWNFTTRRPLNWMVTAGPDTLRRYSWTGELDMDPDLPNFEIFSGSKTLSLANNESWGSETANHFRIAKGARRPVGPKVIRIQGNQGKSYPIYIPQASSTLSFEAKYIGFGLNHVPTVFLNIEGEWNGSITPGAEEYARLSIAAVGVRPGTHILRLDSDWTIPARGPEIFIRNLAVETSMEIEAFLPMKAATPEVRYRPRDPVLELFTGPSIHPNATPQLRSSPWEVYDSDRRWVRAVDIEGLVRTALLMPTPSKWRVRVPSWGPAKVVLFPGVQNPFDTKLLDNAEVRVVWESSGRTKVLWEGQVGYRDARDSMPAAFKNLKPHPWQVGAPRGRSNQPLWRNGLNLALPPTPPGAFAHLTFEARSDKADERSRAVLLGDPTFQSSPRLGRSVPLLSESDLFDWNRFLITLKEAGESKPPSPAKRTHLLIDWKVRVLAEKHDVGSVVSSASRRLILDSLNALISRPDFHLDRHFKRDLLPKEATDLLERGAKNLSTKDLFQLNRMLLDRGFGDSIRPLKRFAPPHPKTPNVILISIDTLRADALSTLGYTRQTSPWMSSYFGERGVLFSNAEAPSTWTLPSHTALFLSQFFSRHGVHSAGDRIASQSTPGPELLVEYGYETAAFVDRGFLHQRYGFYQGFQRFDQMGGGFASILPRCLRWLKKRDSSIPLFLFLHTYDVHSPYDPPEPYHSRFLTSDMVPSYPGLGVPTAVVFNLFNRLAVPYNRGDVEYCRALYDGGILYTDTLLRNFFNQIEGLGLIHDPLVVLISDHGDAFGEHGFWDHGLTVYEELTHVPIFMRFPGDRFAGQKLEDRVSLIDVFPTLFDYLDWEGGEEWQGMSLKPLLDGSGDLPSNRVIYSELKLNQAMYHGFLKLIRNRTTVDPIRNPRRMEDRETYDLETDPGESVNLIHEIPTDITEEIELMEGALWYMTQQRRREGNVGKIVLDESMVEELKALGYLR